MKKVQFSDWGEVAELLATDRRGGDGEIRVGIYNDPDALLRAIMTLVGHGRWEVNVHFVKLDVTPDPRGLA